MSSGVSQDRHAPRLSTARERVNAFVLFAAFAATGISFWIVLHGYEGLVHDSRLYTLQALARLRPSLLGNDVFLRFGSQEAFTFFSPIYAVVISALGIEHAASLLTLVSHVSFFVAAWMLVRAFMPTTYAWLALLLLVTLPSTYGAQGIFQYVESFLTPRLMAEALVISSLAALVCRRNSLAAVLIASATLLHPVMAAAGVTAGFYLIAIRQRLPIARAASILVVGALVLATMIHPGTQARFDTAWREYVATVTPYLFLRSWNWSDWTCALIPLLTLCCGLVALQRSTARDFCKVALLTGLSGIALTAAGTDIAGLVLVAQAQPWRWLWLSGAVSALMIPLIAAQSWQLGPAGRAGILALACAWLSWGEPHAVLLAALSITFFAIARSTLSISRRYERLLIIGVVALVALTVVVITANDLLVANATPAQDTSPGAVRWVRAFLRDGAIAGLATVGIWWAIVKAPAGIRLCICAPLGLGVIAVLMPVALREWRTENYGEQAHAAFAPWRALIPPGSEVLWAGGILPTWLLLERPAYLSNAQIAASLFSRAAALELQRRSRQPASFLEAEGIAPWPPDPTRVRRPFSLRDICEANIPFVVSRHDLGARALSDAPAAAPTRYRGLRLYSCRPSGGTVGGR